jgi:cytochrome c oxidase subunit I+III
MITFIEVAALVAAVELIVTIFKQRAPGMSLNRMPLFVWAILVMAFMIVFAMPPLMVAASCSRWTAPAAPTSSTVEMRGDAAALAAHLLVLRAPRGLHHLRAGAGHRVDHRDLRAAAGVRLHGRRAGRWSHRLHQLRALGAPHVRHRAAQLGHELLHRREHDDRHPSGVQIFCWIATIWGTEAGVHRTPFLFVLGFLFVFLSAG